MARLARSAIPRLALATVGLWLAVALVPGSAMAVEPDEILSDPALEARARQISEGLRCLVCQNQSIDDSHAPLAKDLRLLVRERLKAGDSDQSVRDYVVQRYGEFVLLKPPFNLSTLLLWLTPAALLAVASGLAWRQLRSARPATAEMPLSDDEQRQLKDILARKD
ncbi:MAG: cytochrome c-type biogenesis protein CcmH [Proteobacteria bacterium]|nr:cytochrome c-type biogenesis protein CcmH [Pseudomonadota bacterium]